MYNYFTVIIKSVDSISSGPGPGPGVATPLSISRDDLDMHNVICVIP